MAENPTSQPPKQLFWRQFRSNFTTVGAVLPSSRFLARAMTAPLAQKRGPVRVLEAGAGTGAFTGTILACLQPGDAFDAVEINPQLFASLLRTYGPDSGAQPAGVEARWINDDLRNLPAGPGFDYIIFSLPLTNFPPTLVQQFLDQMIAALKPGGVFSYVKYIFISRFKYAFGGRAIRDEMDANQVILHDFAVRYQIERRSVLRNVPPAWVYYWQKPSGLSS